MIRVAAQDPSLRVASLEDDAWVRENKRGRRGGAVRRRARRDGAWVREEGRRVGAPIREWDDNPSVALRHLPLHKRGL